MSGVDVRGFGNKLFLYIYISISEEKKAKLWKNNKNKTKRLGRLQSCSQSGEGKQTIFFLGGLMLLVKHHNQDIMVP